ncbi:hypothetical protein EWM64_g6712 [Hericium alpestre]|uniref:AB hydrolase-1 domain-containing protein n=1 Tax=Hericium alpestre TaxID=135208 RepID=A0A4Y9ZSU4_9AGAM|nr:hypothetical protein EWM64_g6712 [Hericium alpestre]
MSDQSSYNSFLPPDTFRGIGSSTRGHGFSPDAGTRPIHANGIPAPKNQTSAETAYDSDEDLYESLPATAIQTPVDKPLDADYFSSPSTDSGHVSKKTRLDVDDKSKNVAKQQDPKPSQSTPNLDLCSRIKGMYRILDLISEQGSGGLVDKVIIAQDSLRDFINTLSPGSYATLTKVDFKALDKLAIKPVGIYGSKEELVRFLTSIDAVDRATASQLSRRAQDIHISEPTLRSGLYILHSQTSTVAEQAFVIYWPEETTWNDNAISTVRRNRVTFMRYLMKVSDQRVALISSHHAGAIVWHEDDGDDASMDIDDEESDRLYTFEVAKTKEQEEDVTSREGFKMFSNSIAAYEPGPDCPIDAAHFLPKLLPASTSRHYIVGQGFNRYQLRDLLRDGSLNISEHLEDEYFSVLINNGLRARFPKECEAWYDKRRALGQASTMKFQARKDDQAQSLQENAKQLGEDLLEALINEILQLYPALDHDSFVTENARLDEQQRSLAIDRFRNMCTIYPKVGAYFKEALQETKLDTIKSTDFRAIKERLLVLYTLFRTHKSMSQSTRSELVSVVLNDGNFQNLSRVLDGNPRAKGGVFVTIATTMSYFWGSSPDSSKSETDALVKEARGVVFELSDAEFLRKSAESKKQEDQPLIKSAVADITQIARDQLIKTLSGVHKKILHRTIFLQREECQKQLEREVKNEDALALHEARAAFLRQIAERSQAQSNLFTQLLESDKILLVLADIHGKISIYLENVTSIEGAIKREKYKKLLHRDKIGHAFLLAFDEAKRTLVLCASEKLQLHIFVFDETFGNLQAWGSSINMTPWYQPDTIIHHICFVYGSEEVLLVDSHSQARIVSLVSLQFRPATVDLGQIPKSVLSAPDGSCMLVLQDSASGVTLTAYHWSTFGSTEGIPLSLPDFPLSSALLSSMGNRHNVHLLGLDLASQSCRSLVLDIKRKVTEFMFKEKGGKASSTGTDRHSEHNALIDCHAEMWTRFPVVAAVGRRTITSSSDRHRKALTFVTDQGPYPFASYFADMIQTFERTTRKPTGEELQNLVISTSTFGKFHTQCLSEKLTVSSFRLGEWLADLLCLIPIHIAVCRENRFIPLKDGIFSPELEKSLLGAEVTRIMDNLSFGWYESLFQSYMANKRVKVVSSMGEQSVGKSFALNHLVDTSFAGSAMRTTEGVWMSVTPTDEALIVALDFEAMYQVLFRNNFALSRDITGLFQSFQSSSSVLDPAANPSLFQSTLVIIIKDVVDSDKAEITREFSLKFQKIVQEEQDANFISRLHAGKLNIIPWPVIESREFYKLFGTLKKRLDQQRTTHNTAGEFLHTLKTLMAKLKANDWGALSQTMAAHRAQNLLALLPTALETGFADVEFDSEPLKNMDNDVPIEKPDTEARFLLSGSKVEHSDRDRILSTLRKSWDHFNSRQNIADSDWITELDAHIGSLVDLRIDHVREWIASNLSRFQTSHASIEELRRTFENCVVDLRSNVQLCKAQCASCHLFCVRGRLHDGAHDCETGTHRCIHICVFCDEQDFEERPCGMRAGHSGRHICAVNMHLCGERCEQIGKPGCLEECAKVAGHPDGDHCCAASVHMCGESIEATFTGRHETFQYTKYNQISKRLKCIKMIAPGDTTHEGAHNHSAEKNPFHFCEARCESCGYFCTLPLGHTQQEHETRHGSMSQTRWAIDGPDGTVVELEGRKFSANDEGAPMMCNLVCLSLGRHAHIDYCRTEEGTLCDGPDIQHIHTRMSPAPDRAKDYITHALHWRRMGFKDPYPRDEQTNFAKCDAMCPGPEHAATATAPAQPSFCTLPMFHPPQNPNTAVAGMGHISNDGHQFSCRNPVVMQQAFHVIFVIDRSGSMSSNDRRPLPNAPATDRIARASNNRLGAVLSALYGFWSAQAVHFAPKGYGLVVPDMLGYGGTDKPTDTKLYVTSALARDVVELLDAENLHKVIVIGHDWGARITSRVLILFPERVAAVGFLALGYATPTTADYATINKAVRAAVGRDLFGYWEYFSEEGAAKTIEQNMDSFISLLFPNPPELWDENMCTFGGTKAWIESNRQSPLPAYVTPAIKEHYKTDLLKGGIAGPLQYYTVNTAGYNAADDAKIPESAYKFSQPAFFASTANDRICLPAAQIAGLKAYGTGPLTHREFDSDHWIMLSHSEKLNAELEAWIEGLALARA